MSEAGEKKILMIKMSATLVALSLGTFVNLQIARALDLSQNFNFDGVLLNDSTGLPMVGPVALKFQVYDPAATCLVFEETFAAVTIDADGGFSLKIGSGTRASAAVDGGLALKTIFQNSGIVRGAGAGCAGGYTPATGDGRKLRVAVNGTALTPDFALTPVPMATVAETLQGKTVSDFVASSGPSTMQGPLTLSNQGEVRYTSTNANYVSLQAPSALGSSTTYLLPSVDGTAGNCLTTNGAGMMSWGSCVVGGGTVTATTISATGAITANAGITVTTGVVVLPNGSAAAPSMQVGASGFGFFSTGTGIGMSTAGLERFRVDNSGKFGIGTTTPTAMLHLIAGTATAGTAPLKLSPGVNLSTPEPGAIEFDGTNLYYTDSGSVRRTLSSAGAGVNSLSVTMPITNSGTASDPIIGVSAATTSVSGVVQLALNGGTTANTAVQATDARLSDSRLPMGPASGDLSGAYPSPTVTKMQGVGVSMTAPASGQVMKYVTGPNEWTPSNFGVGDLLTSVGAQQFGAASCNPNQTLTWSGLTNTFNCSIISGLDGSTIATGSISPARLPASATAWTTSGPNVYFMGGNIGIGTSSPAAELDVLGDIQLAGDLIAGGVIVPDGGTASMPGVDFMGMGNGLFWDNGMSKLGLSIGSMEKMVILPSGHVGIGVSNPVATLDINGTMKLMKHVSSPVACTMGVDGMLALTSQYTMCVCKGGASNWVRTTDGTSACVW